MTSFTHMHLLLVSDYSHIKHTTGFAREHLPLVSYYSQVYTKVHDRSYSLVFLTRQLSLVSSVLLVSHEPNTQVILKFSQGTSTFFVNLDVKCTVVI